MDIKRIAKIGKGTKRKKRDINLLELAEEIKSLYEENKSLEKTGKIVKLSPEMVRQFIKVNHLDDKVKDLIKKGLITSVDICYRISKLSKNEQVLLAKHIIDKSLNSDDVRAIVKFKINNPEIPIVKATEKVIQSKDKKIYVAYFGIEEDNFKKISKLIANKKIKESKIKSIFLNFIPAELIASFELNGRVVILKVYKDGVKKLRNKAKELKIPLPRLANVLVNKYIESRKL